MPPRSPWLWAETWDDEGVETQLLVRQCGDGVLTALVSIHDDIGWNCALSFVGRVDNTRYPTWDEALDAAQQLLPHDLQFMAHLVASREGHISTIYLQQNPSPGGHIR